MMSKKNLMITLPFLILGLFFRVYRVGTIPGGIDVDEAAFGYNAYSILKTGRDEWARFLPLDAFTSFGDYKLPLFFYLLIPMIAVFGLSIRVIRLTSVFLGLLNIVFIFWLARILGKFPKKGKKSFVLVPALSIILLSISPWHIIMSRKGTEQVCSLLMLTVASFLFLKYLKRRTTKNLALFTLFFLFSCASYYSSRAFSLVFFPLAYGFFITPTLKEIKLKTYFNESSLKFFGAVFLVFLYVFFSSKSAGGLTKVWQNSPFGAFNRQGIINRINEHQESCRQIKPSFFCKLIYNKPLIFTETLIQNYLGHYNLIYFFTHGFEGSDRSFMSNKPLFYLFEIFFLFLGLIRVFKLRGFVKPFLLLWFFIFPLPDSITGVFSSRRLLIGLPVLVVINALGLAFLLDFLKKRFKKKTFHLSFYFLFFLLTLLSLTRLFFDYKKFTEFESRFWWYPERQVFNYLKSVDKSYKKVCFSTIDPGVYILYSFIHSVEPSFFHKNVSHFLKKDQVALEWVETKSIGRYYFISDCDVKQTEKLEDTLVIFDRARLGKFPNKYSHFYKKLGSFFDQNNDLVYEVYSYNK